jgi:hypothetical protein
MFKSFLMLSLILVNTTAFSQESDPAFTIKNIEVFQVENADKATVELPILPTLPTLPINPIDEVAMYVDGIIALGKKIWPIIEAGKPVINTDGMQPSLSILPRFPSTATYAELYDMADWSQPKAVSYRVSFKNGFNIEVIGFTYTVYFQYNGSYQGSGKYLTSLIVQPSEVYAAWGFKFDATSELVNVANVGSAENPVASAILKISYKGRGINEQRNSRSFYVDGNGNMKALNN